MRWFTFQHHSTCRRYFFVCSWHKKEKCHATTKKTNILFQILLNLRVVYKATLTGLCTTTGRGKPTALSTRHRSINQAKRFGCKHAIWKVYWHLLLVGSIEIKVDRLINIYRFCLMIKWWYAVSPAGILFFFDLQQQWYLMNRSIFLLCAHYSFL